MATLTPNPATKTTATHQRVTIKKAGSYDRLELETLPGLEPGPGEVVIDVKAIGVNYADVVVRMGLYASAKEFVGWPITPGFEVAGHVKAVGEGVVDLAPGERVYAVTLFNGYASEVCVPRNQVFVIPDGLTLEQAAGVPAVLCWRTKCVDSAARIFSVAFFGAAIIAGIPPRSVRKKILY